jgi:alpha-tubulin suppressor-like RCC1 family protein
VRSRRLLVLLSLVACTTGSEADEPGIRSVATPELPERSGDSLTGLSSIAAGGSHVCALEHGRVLCWGVNHFDILAVGLHQERIVSKPQPVLGLGLAEPIVQIAAGYNFTCALARSGHVYCWGENGEGQLGVGDLDRHDRPTLVPGVRASQLYAHYGHACGLAHDRRTGWCWGSGEFGDGRQHKRESTPIELAVLAKVDQLTHRCWLRNSDVRCWGDNSSGQVGNGEGGCDDDDDSGCPPGFPCARERTCKHVDQPTAPLGLPAIVQIATNYNYSFALDRKGGVWQWGQLGTAPSTEPRPNYRPQRIAKLPPVVQIAAGDAHACARTESGELWCWGENSSGQLGFEDDDHRVVEHEIPRRVEGLPAVRDVVAGSAFTCALAGAGEHTQAWCWGDNHTGQLGDGAYGRRSTPALVHAPPT